MTGYLREHIFAIIAATATIIGTVFLFINYLSDDKELKIYGEFNGSGGYITPSGFAVNWKFNVINNSKSDIVVTSIGMKSHWGDGFLIQPASVGESTAFLKPKIIPARSNEILSITTHHNVNDKLLLDQRDILIEIGFMEEEERKIISNRNLKMKSDEISDFLNSLWERNFQRNKSEGEIFSAKNFGFMFGNGCDGELVQKSDPMACITMSLSTSDGQQFESEHTMAGYYSQPDCRHISNKGLCESSDTVVIDLTDGGCISLLADDLGNVKPEKVDCQN